MPYISPNTQAIYQAVVYGHGPLLRPWQYSVCLAARVPGGPYDNADNAAYYCALNYTGLLSSAFNPAVSYDYIWCYTHPYDPAAKYVQRNLGDEHPPDLTRVAPEASFILRRAGAGAPSHVRGRLHLPCPTDSLFTDLPHRRHLDVSHPEITTMVDSLNTAVSDPLSLFREVLFSRETGGAWDVTQYSIAARPGRVWQRAGWPHR